MNKIGLNELDNGWIFDEQNIYESLNDALCCIAMNTTSIFDAILAGCYVIPISSELNIFDNNFDIIQSEFPHFKSVNSSEVKTRIHEYYFNNSQEIKDAYKSVQSQIYNGINAKSAAYLSQF